MHWISGEPADGRYVVVVIQAHLFRNVYAHGYQCGFVEFVQPVKTVAAGQSAVLYDRQVAVALLRPTRVYLGGSCKMKSR